MAELDLFNSYHQKRKHKLHTDLEVPPRQVKRPRLESMLENLTISGDPEPPGKKTEYCINSLIEPLEPEIKKRRTTDLDSLIQEKLTEVYKEQILQRLALIAYVHPLTIIVRHFQQWVKRLFNLFVRKYNERTRGSRNMRPFKSFARIIALTRDPSVAFTYRDLLNIVFDESALELQRLLLKKEKRLDSEKLQEIRDEEELARESKYTYWDRVSALAGDVDMEEYGNDTRVGSCHPGNYFDTLSTSMDTDMLDCGTSTEFPTESNYGNYYGTSYTAY